MEIEKLIHDIVDPLVENKESVGIRIMPTENENEMLILVLASGNDIARLIGRGGTVADSIRKVASVMGKLNDKHIRIKFESFDEDKKDGKTL